MTAGSQNLEMTANLAFSTAAKKITILDLPELLVFFGRLVPQLLSFVRVPESLGELGHGPVALSTQFVAKGPDRLPLKHHLKKLICCYTEQLSEDQLT